MRATEKNAKWEQRESTEIRYSRRENQGQKSR